MRDVAERSGVAVSTVSHVINGTKYVSPAIREKVLRVLGELNYHRDAHARRLASGHSDFLGLIISDIENPFYPGLIKAFETSALANGFEVLLCTTNYDPARTRDAFRKMIENKSPGVAVMTSRVEPELAKLLADQGVASVFLDSDGPGPRRSNIRLNYAKGAKEAIRYLHRLGHRQFALIAGPQHRASHAAYRNAIDAAVKDCGLELRVIAGDNKVAGGERIVQTMFAEKTLPTALLCSNDLTAVGAMHALLKCGLRIPEDISVIGADGVPFAALTQPPLTTVRIPRERLGAMATEILMEVLRRGRRQGRECILDTELVLRESAGPPITQAKVAAAFPEP